MTKVAGDTQHVDEELVAIVLRHWTDNDIEWLSVIDDTLRLSTNDVQEERELQQVRCYERLDVSEIDLRFGNQLVMR